MTKCLKTRFLITSRRSTEMTEIFGDMWNIFHFSLHRALKISLNYMQPKNKKKYLIIEATIQDEVTGHEMSHESQHHRSYSHKIYEHKCLFIWDVQVFTPNSSDFGCVSYTFFYICNSGVSLDKPNYPWVNTSLFILIIQWISSNYLQ